VPAPTTASIRGAVTRYRVMAFVVGVTLLLFCGAMFAKYVLDRGSDTLIAMAHGWLFMIYAVLALDLAIRMRWSLGRMFFMVVAGMIPFLSFVAEHKVVGWVHAELDSGDATAPSDPAPSDAAPSDPAPGAV